MKLIKFRILNCFGFLDSGQVQLADPNNFIYLLGRNSSGKSSLLSAIKYFELGIVPQVQPNFENFNDSGKPSWLIGTFSINQGELNFDQFVNAARSKLKELGLDESALKTNAALNSAIDSTLEIYREFLENVGKSRAAIEIKKDRSGHYHFLDEGDDRSYKARKQQIENLIRKVSNSGQFAIRNQSVRIDLTFQTFEDVLFRQTPNIYLFNEKYSLRDALPERIASGWRSNNNSFEKLFIGFLDDKTVDRFLQSNDPDEREQLLQNLRKRLSSLTEKVNQHRPATEKHDLLEITLHEKNGIQITIKTDGKKSYYSHLSDNTKFLFAYYLYQ
jgi:AAA15 family ATPase/GTPase